MKRKKILRLGLGLMILVGVSVIAVEIFTGHWSLVTHKVSSDTVYYCPMHPTYTSDRPGDCPICNMRLVKREAPSHQESMQHTAHSTEQAKKAPKDICYLHHCPMAHAGKPCPMLVVAKEGEKVQCPVCGFHVMDRTHRRESRKILYWTDPMIPGYKSDKPGKSPMGMDLIAVYEENGTGFEQPVTTPAGYAPILVTHQKQQLIGVKTAVVVQQAMTKTIRTVGTVAHDPELYQAQAEFIKAYEVWQRAQSGTIPEIAEQAQQLVESSRLRLRHLGLSDAMIDEVKTWTQPDHRLLLGGAGQFWIYASVYEYELPLIHPPQQAIVTIDALVGHPFTGTVKAMDPMVDSTTRTMRVRILVDDPEGFLKPQMYVNVGIAVDLGEVLAIPEEAVFHTGMKQIVFVDKGQGLFEPRDVTVGVKADGYYEIKDGVSEGEAVVTSGNFLIDSESRLKAALEDMGGEGHSHGP